MDIRIINSQGMIINATNLSISAENNYLVGLTEAKQQVLIETCKSKEEAVSYLDGIKHALKVGTEEQSNAILVDLEGKEYKCCGRCKDDKKDS